MQRTIQTNGRTVAKRTAVSAGLVVAGVLLTVGFAFAAGVVLEGVVGLNDGAIAVLDLYLTQAGFAAVAGGFLAVVGREFVSVRRPTRRELRLGGLLVAVALAAETTRQLAVRVTPLDAASTLAVGNDVGTIATVAILLGTIVVAPLAEELLFRGVVQRYVSVASSSTVGIAVATALFVPMHGMGIFLTAPTVAAAAAVAGVLVVLSTATGIAYARTETLAVPIAVHAAYNLLVPFVAAGVHW